MATAESVTPSPTSVIIDAVIKKAKDERWSYVHSTILADEKMKDITHLRQEAALARERWEHCILWFDEHVPNWREILPEHEVQKIMLEPKDGLSGG